MMGEYRLSAVIPAAGLSSRMGRFKPLLPYADHTVIEAAVSSALPYVDTAVAVLGNRADDLRKVLSHRFGDKVISVVNPDYAATDMLTSVKIGLNAIENCDAFFLLPADMPQIPGAVYRALIDAYGGEKEALFPLFNGRRGHPPLIAGSLIPEILSYEGEGGLKAALKNCGAREVIVRDSGILVDLDTPADYARYFR